MIFEPNSRFEIKFEFTRLSKNNLNIKLHPKHLLQKLTDNLILTAINKQIQRHQNRPRLDAEFK